jgi:predicted dehydrogenase
MLACPRTVRRDRGRRSLCCVCLFSTETNEAKRAEDPHNVTHASDPPLSRSRPVRFAIIGCGRMGRLHSERLIRDGRGQVVALFDVDSAAAESLQNGPANGAAVYRRFEDLVREVEADVAVVCTPTQLHFEQATALLQRGMPVLCEKPLAKTRTEIIELTSAARRSGTPLCVAYQRRLLAVYRTLRRLVRSGQFGPVRAVMSHNIENWQQTIAGTWRDDPQSNPGGFIGDAGSHKIDAVFFVTGLDPIDVFARCDTCGSHVEVSASVSAQLAGGVPLTIDFIGHAQHFSETLSVHCAEGDLVLRNSELWVGRAGRAEQLPLTEADSNPITGFLDLLLDGAENFAPPECALPVYDFTQAIFESARRKAPVAIG